MTGIRKRRWPCEDTEMDTGSMPREDGGRDQGDTAEARGCGRLPTNTQKGRDVEEISPSQCSEGTDHEGTLILDFRFPEL